MCIVRNSSSCMEKYWQKHCCKNGANCQDRKTFLKFSERTVMWSFESGSWCQAWTILTERNVLTLCRWMQIVFNHNSIDSVHELRAYPLSHSDRHVNRICYDLVYMSPVWQIQQLNLIFIPFLAPILTTPTPLKISVKVISCYATLRNSTSCFASTADSSQLSAQWS